MPYYLSNVNRRGRCAVCRTEVEPGAGLVRTGARATKNAIVCRTCAAHQV